ncbi:MAG: histidine kinase dimerization/phosphoacceptor domain -containing protein [Methanoregula sp.]|nr:histidine kinase dimerization/phosphoacceptor domain -containing protein [Methanoregula sp.]
MFVDDEEVICDITRRFLEKDPDIKVDTFLSAEAALEALKTRRYDVIVSDYEMPGLDGIAFLKQLKSTGNPTPFIIFSGKGREAVIIEALNNGADFYLQKGGDPQALFAELRNQIRHIDQKEKARAALRESEERYRIITENMDDTIWLIDVNQNLTFISPSAERKRGYSSKELRSMPLLDHLALPFRPVVLDILTKMIEGSKKDPNHHFTRTLDLEFRNKDHSSYWAETTISLIKKPDGTPAGFMGLGRDITERKKAEAVIRAESERAKALLRISQMGGKPDDEIARFALGKTLELTGSPVGYLGYTCEDESEITMVYWPVKTAEECTVKEKPLTLKVSETGLLAEAIRQRKPVITNDYAAPSPLKKGLPEGHVPLTRHMNIPLFEKDHIVAVVGVGNKETDYTEADVQQLTLLMDAMWRVIEKKKADALILSSLHEKEMLLKEIHHRVKNNLQIIGSLLYLQSVNVSDPFTQGILRECRARVKSMALIHEKLYRSKDIGRIPFVTYLEGLVDALKDSYGVDDDRVTFDIAVTPEDLTLNIETGIPCGLLVNELLSNSLKYAFPDGRTGRIRIEIGQTAPRNYTLVIADNGVGFPKVVDFRNTPSLGLQLVNNLVSQLDGEIELDSSAGTKFSIRFAGIEEPVKK